MALLLLLTACISGQTASAQLWLNTTSGTLPRSVATSSSLGTATTRASDPQITDCQAALVSWTALSASLATTYNETKTYVAASSHTIQYGGARNVSVVSGVTRADALPNVTSLGTWKDYYTFIATDLATSATASVPPRPDCTIEPSSCSKLWDIYSTSLGLTDGNSVAFVPPSSSMTNSPRCTINGSPKCLTRRWLLEKPYECGVNADSVKVFYWPSEATSTATKPRSVITDGITMVSPSVYLSYSKVFGVTGGGYWIDCESSSGSERGFWATTMPGPLSNVWVSGLLDQFSTLERAHTRDDWPPYALSVYSSINPSNTWQAFPDAALTAMLNKNATDYQMWAEVIRQATGSVVSRPLVLTELTAPGPRAYYLRPRRYDRENAHAYGCYPQGPHPNCDTIFNDDYHAQFSVPSALVSMHPDWATCGPGGWGSYDPPIALTAVDEEVSITVTGGHAPTSTSAQPGPTVPGPATTTSSSAGSAATQNSPEFPFQPETSVDRAANVLAPSKTTAGSDPGQTKGNGGQPGAGDPANNGSPSQAVSVTITDNTFALPAAGSKTVTGSVSGSQMIISGNTVNPGAAVTVGDTTFSRLAEDPKVIVALPAAPTGANSGAKVAQAGTGSGALQITSSGNVFLVGGSTIAPGGVITQGDKTISINPSGAAFVNGAAVSFSNVPAPAAPTGANSEAKVAQAGSGSDALRITSSGGVFLVGGSTIAPGGVITQGDKTISINPSGAAFVNGAAVSFSNIAAPAAPTSTTAGIDGYIINGITPDHNSGQASSSRARYTGAAAQHCVPTASIFFSSMVILAFMALGLQP